MGEQHPRGRKSSIYQFNLFYLQRRKELWKTKRRELFNLSIDILSRQQNVNYLQDYDHFLKKKNTFHIRLSPNS